MTLFCVGAMGRSRCSAGFTLIEMLAVLAVLGLLLALFSRLNWLGTEASRVGYDLRSFFSEAKQEAIRRNHSVWVSHSDTKAWTCLDSDTDCLNAGEGAYRTLDLKVYRGPFSLSSDLPDRCLRWRPEGFPSRCEDHQPLKATVYLSKGSEPARELCISPGGAIRLERPGVCP